jgi:hypothetical protein
MSKNEGPQVELKLNITQDLMNQIKEFQHVRRMDTRKAAVILLLQAGLKTSSVKSGGK